MCVTVHFISPERRETKWINTIHWQSRKRGDLAEGVCPTLGTAEQFLCLLQEVSHCLERNEGAGSELSGSTGRHLLQIQLGIVSRLPPPVDMAWMMLPLPSLLAWAPRGDLHVSVSA